MKEHFIFWSVLFLSAKKYKVTLTKRKKSKQKKQSLEIRAIT